MTQKLTLSVNTLDATKAKGKGKAVATTVFIKAGPLVLTVATMGGRWNQDQTLNELKKNPKRFSFTAEGKAILNSLGIAA